MAAEGGRVRRAGGPLSPAVPSRSPEVTLGLELLSVSALYLPAQFCILSAARTVSYLVSLVRSAGASCGLAVVVEQIVGLSEVLGRLL